MDYYQPVPTTNTAPIIISVVLCVLCIISSIVIVLNKRWFAKVKKVFGQSLQDQAKCKTTEDEETLLKVIDESEKCPETTVQVTPTPINLGGKCFASGTERYTFTNDTQGIFTREYSSRIPFTYSIIDENKIRIMLDISTVGFNFIIGTSSITNILTNTTYELCASGPTGSPGTMINIYTGSILP
jgi:hypothetical protein